MKVIAFFLLCGGLNFLLGVALAVGLSRDNESPLKVPSWSSLTLGKRIFNWLRTFAKIASKLRSLLSPPTKSPATTITEADVPSTSTAAELTPAVDPACDICKQLEPQWQETLSQAGIEPQSYVEATAHVLRLDVGKYRERLVLAQEQARTLLETASLPEVVSLRNAILAFNADWLEIQKVASAGLLARRGRLDEYNAAGSAVEEVLLDQAALIEGTVTTLTDLDLHHDAQLATKRILEELKRLIDMAHALRDRMQNLLGTITALENRQSEVRAESRIDVTTGLPNRLGLEYILWEWEQANPSHERIATVCLLDLDRFAKLNDQLGTRVADQLLAACCTVLSQLLRRGRGFDHVVRFEGQRLLLFLGDSTVRQALASLERIRQSLEAMSFEFDGKTIELTASGAVREWHPAESTTEALEHLRSLTATAKQAGRNRIVLEENGQSAVIREPPQFPVQARTVVVAVE